LCCNILLRLPAILLLFLQVYGFKTVPVINVDTGCWVIRQCHGDAVHGYPLPRRCHSCVQLGHEAFICGGYNGTQIFNDLWVINLSTMKWTCLPATIPDPVYFHSAAVTDNGLMLVHGGVVQIDTRRSSKVYAIWLKVPPLKELCWQSILASVADIDQISSHQLLDIGVPPDLVERVH
jgi:Galactose oxidase, central domain